METSTHKLDQSDIEILENTLSSKYYMIFKSAGLILLACVGITLYHALRERPLDIGISIVVGTIIFIPFLCITWFVYIKKIKADLKDLEKKVFKAKVIDKRHDSVIGFEEYVLDLDKNDLEISEVNVDKNIFEYVAVFSTVELSIAPHSKTCLSCSYIS